MFRKKNNFWSIFSMITLSILRIYFFVYIRNVFYFIMTNEFKNILVPLDDSKNSMRALNKAITLANLTNAKLTIVHVISYPKRLAKLNKSHKETMTQNATKFLDKITRYVSRENVSLDKKILYGSTTDEITKLMRKKKFDLVIVGRRGTSNHPGSVLGSVSHALVHQSKVPILVMT